MKRPDIITVAIWAGWVAIAINSIYAVWNIAVWDVVGALINVIVVCVCIWMLRRVLALRA